MSGATRAELLDVSDAARIRGAWADLAGRCLEPSVFNEPDFALAAARHLAHGRKPLLALVWGGDGALLAVCPVASGFRAPFAAARQWTHAQATEAFPLLDRARALDAFDGLLDALLRLKGAPAAMLWTGLPERGGTAALIRARANAFVRLDPRSRAVLTRGVAPSPLPGKTRKELRRQERRLSEQGALHFVSATEPDATAALGRFLELEAQGWKGRRGSALADRGDTRAFVIEAVAALAARGLCRIDGLEVGGRPAAMGIVLRSGGRAFYWKTAYDEALARFSPGVQLTLRLTERQFGDDVAWTDSCAIPGHSMIDRLWSDRMAVADYLVALRPGPPTAFRLAGTLERERRRLRARAKALASVVRR